MDKQISACPVCEAFEASIVSRRDRHGAPLHTRLCESCGHVFNDPIPGPEELAAFYARDYRTSYKGAAKPRGRQIARNFGRVERFWTRWSHVMRNHARVLDVGAGSGEFVYFAQDLGHEVIGVEPNAPYAEYCRSDLGLDVRTASIEDLASIGGTYDFIRLNHVVEHLRDPVEALERVARHLASDGVLYIEVPNIIGYAAVKSPGHIFHYGHISNFSPWTLRAAAGRAGLVEVGETAGAMQNAAAAFFMRGDCWSAEQARNRTNAECVAAALGDDATRLSPLGRAAKLARKIWRNVDDTRIAARAGAPRMIGRYYVSRYKAAHASRTGVQGRPGLKPSRT